MSTDRAMHKVYCDLDDTNVALNAWWAANHLDAQNAALHAALEGLLRAVSTLALLVERERDGQPSSDSDVFAGKTVDVWLR